MHYVNREEDVKCKGGIDNGAIDDGRNLSLYQHHYVIHLIDTSSTRPKTNAVYIFDAHIMFS